MGCSARLKTSFELNPVIEGKQETVLLSFQTCIPAHAWLFHCSPYLENQSWIHSNCMCYDITKQIVWSIVTNWHPNDVTMTSHVLNTMISLQDVLCIEFMNVIYNCFFFNILEILILMKRMLSPSQQWKPSDTHEEIIKVWFRYCYHVIHHQPWHLKVSILVNVKTATMSWCSTYIISTITTMYIPGNLVFIQPGVQGMSIIICVFKVSVDWYWSCPHQSHI